MSSFAILVTSAPCDNQLSYHGVNFCQAALNAGHSLTGVFFYGQGTLNTTSLSVTLADTHSVTKDWKQLAEQHNVPMFACVTAANTRGILTEQDAHDADLQHHNMASWVTSSGLGEWVTLSSSADKVVQF